MSNRINNASDIKKNSELNICAEMAKFRSDFPILAREMNGHPLAYLDNGATTQKPKVVIAAITNYFESYNANIHRSAYKLSERATAAYEEAHKKVAGFINAPRLGNLVFTRNCTEAINLVAYSWGRSQLKKGDHILISQMEHHSNLVPWQILVKEKDLILDFLPITAEGVLDLNRLPDLFTDRTKFVSITHTSNVLGTINPLKEIIQYAHNHGAVVLVDGAQSVPHFKVDVQDLDCDFLAFSGHKMLAPTGIGALYGKEEHLEKMPPFLAGGDMIADVTFENSTWQELPWKFEAGTPSIAEGIGFGVAVDYLNQIGMEKIWAHEQILTKYLIEQLQSWPGVKIFGPDKNRTGVISFAIDGIHPHDIATCLDQYGVAIRAGFHCAQPLMKLLKVQSTARASLYLYNTKEDIDQFIKAINKTMEFFLK